MDAFDIGVLSDRFRFMVIDSRLNKKNFSIFETRETRSDTLDLILMARNAINREGDSKLKIVLV
jgi:hypothetical protein